MAARLKKASESSIDRGPDCLLSVNQRIDHLRAKEQHSGLDRAPRAVEQHNRREAMRDNALCRRPMKESSARPRSDRHPVDFDRVNRAALAVLPSLLARWLPGGRTKGAEYVVRNPRRVDFRPGSFRVNIRTGRWADFAIDRARGGDVVSLAAYLGCIGQVQAAERLADMLGVEMRHGR
jgi:hypothetical protein